MPSGIIPVHFEHELVSFTSVSDRTLCMLTSECFEFSTLLQLTVRWFALSGSSQEFTPGRSENKLDRIRNWSSALTAEERDIVWTFLYYVWPKNVIRLRELLKSSRRKLIAVIGVQGVG